MKKRINKILSPALALSCAIIIMTSTANAGSISPTHDITLSKGTLTLGDVFKDVTTNADHILAPAPIAGQTMVLNSHDLQRIANAFGLDWMPQSRMERSIVRRSTSYVPQNDVITSLAVALKKATNNQNYEIELSSNQGKIAISSDEQPDIAIKNLRFNRKTGSLRSDVILSTSTHEKTIHVRGHAYQMATVPVLTKRLRQGDIIESSDIQLISMRLNNIASNAILDETKLIGQTPRRYIDAMHTIQPQDVRTPIVVKKGERVTLSLQGQILNLTTVGKALGSGSTGDIIRVINISSNRIIEGEVIGPQHIKITNIATIGTL